ncbi:unnamed protein product [Brachionus calyciflorus]|uniref:BolA-like protein 3 n=1 Tax=Brachionus calyciflorus TaxID=104777 RepID=A0A814KRH2_9BILA|nr:unnamed protein product [Brachionus calyciflorus]
MSSIRFLGLIRSISQSKNLLVKQSYFKLDAQRTFLTSSIRRNTDTPSQPNEGEQKLTNLLRTRFPSAKTIEVVDISGGCGAMYTIYVETSEFKNLRTVKQHQLVNDCLKTEIRNNMHGLRIQTAIPKE